ncbi:MAG: UDP-2,3-diacylglucosamine diphosphatase LpxI [Synergistaceae bacterium]|jgi:DUF1009 family protein|nr:UDP-2,3-diacylglucosamine diphosphatase LpxI [Synergistaceae bacterium]
MSIALIAGEGALPEIIASRLAGDDKKPFIYAMRENNDELAPNAAKIIPLFRAELESTLRDMASRGVRQVMFAGLVPKTLIYRPEMLDGMGRDFVASLVERDDHSLIGGLANFVEMAGFEVIGYRDLLGDLLATEGHIAGREQTEDERADVDYGREIAGKLLPLSFGQSVVISRKSVVAVEAMEGTDATVLRAGALCRKGVLVKMMKRGQDARYDIPIVGPQTLQLMAKARLSCLAIQAGWTLILFPDEFSRVAGEQGVSVVGVDY